MRRPLLLLVVLPLSLSVAACGATPSPSPVSSAPSAASVASGSEAPSGAPSSGTPSADASASASDTPSSATPSASPSVGPSATPTSTPTSAPTAAPTALDPCVLMTRTEAAKLARLSVGAGKESTVENRRYCTYAGAGALVTVIVAQAPSAALLAEAKAAVLADLEAATHNGMKASTVSGIGDAAALLTFSQSSGTRLNVIAIYVVKGLTFYAIIETTLGRTLASAQAIEAQAKTTAKRVP